ncbi:MAG: hypothetical protein K2P12_04110, partial [Clostridia bacterium]|nr:hypothetical protein [Clostridia bacterium]
SMRGRAKDLTKMFRKLFAAQTIANPEKVLSLPSEITNRLIGMKEFSADRILQCVETMSTVEANMRYSSMPRTLVEASIAKCADSKANIDLTGVVMRLKALEEKIATGNFSAANEVASAPKTKRAFSKSACCGYLIKMTRDMKKFALYSELTELNKDNFSLIDEVVHIKPARANMAKTLLMPEYFEIIKNLIVNEFEGVKDVVISTSEKIVNIDDDIAFVKGIFDKDIINLK